MSREEDSISSRAAITPKRHTFSKKKRLKNKFIAGRLGALMSGMEMPCVESSMICIKNRPARPSRRFLLFLLFVFFFFFFNFSHIFLNFLRI